MMIIEINNNNDNDKIYSEHMTAYVQRDGYYPMCVTEMKN